MTAYINSVGTSTLDAFAPPQISNVAAVDTSLAPLHTARFITAERITNKIEVSNIVISKMTDTTRENVINEELKSMLYKLSFSINLTLFSVLAMVFLTPYALAFVIAGAAVVTRHLSHATTLLVFKRT